MKRSIFDLQAGDAGAVLDDRRFSGFDQERFAVLSGDRNPIHLDEQAARVTFAGGRVVHGVHLVLWALETACGRFDVRALGALTVKFLKFALVDEHLTLALGAGKGGDSKLEVLAGGQVLMSLTLKTRPVSAPSAIEREIAPLRQIPPQPEIPTVHEMESLRACLRSPVSAAAFEEAFPNASRDLGSQRLAGLAVLSSLVGMVCPGRDSIFSQFQVEFTAGDKVCPEIVASTKGYDPRFRLVSIAFAGAGLQGDVSAYHRFPPIETPLSTIAAMVRPGEFAGRRALVVGGSRGLGAATAKLIVAGGGSATITYAKNLAKAIEISEELCLRYGHGRCAVAQLDAANVSQAELWRSTTDFTHMYYFATPAIFRRGQAVLEFSEFSEFAEIYIHGFFEVVSALAVTGRPLSVLYPSSVSIEKRPKGMTAYAMAKAAGEILCQDIQRSMPFVTIRAPRLPRVLTDQTATVPPVPAPDAAEVMLPILRAESAPAS